MKLRSIWLLIAAITLLSATPTAATGSVVESTEPELLSIQAIAHDNLDPVEAVREFTLRYKVGVNPLDPSGRPNGTAHIEGVTFIVGYQYPNNIRGVHVQPAVSGAQASEIAESIKATGLVEFVDVMFPIQIDELVDWHECGGTTPATGEDPCLSRQSWYLDAIGIGGAWNDEDVNTQHAVVAVVDTGKLNHPDIVDNLLPGYDFLEQSRVWDELFREWRYLDGFEHSGDGDGHDDDPTDEGNGRDGDKCTTTMGYDFDEVNGFVPFYTYAPARDSVWHGTAVSSIIAAANNNNIGITGVAPAVKVVPVRGLGRCSANADGQNLVNGIIWASGGTVDGIPTNNHVPQVVNLSLGAYQNTSTCPQVYRDAISGGLARGVVFVASVGNDPEKLASHHTPSNCPGVISVGAVGPPSGSTFTKASYSTSNADVVAPGGDIQTSYSQGILVASNTETRSLTNPVYQYKFGQGTSYSAPIVSALIAMVKTKYRTTADNNRLTPAAIKAAVKHAATLGPQCTGCGDGLLTGTNLFAVLDPSTAPTPVQSLNASGGPFTINQGAVTWSAPLSNAWNPMTSYVATAYSAAVGGTVVDTCSPSSLSQLSCFFDDLEENTTYYVSVTSIATTSTESARTALTTFRRAAAPTGVSTTAGAGKATVRWSEVTDMGDFNDFGLYEAIAYTTQTGGSPVSTCYGSTECDIENLTGGTQYWIEVSIMTGHHPGGSIPSARIAVTPNVVPVAPPAPSVPNPAAPTVGNPEVGGGTPAKASPATIKSRVGKTVRANNVLKSLKIKATKGSKVTLRVSGSSRKVCQVVRGSIKIIGKGTCSVTATIKPAKGKSSRGTVRIVV
jgi:serine protease